MLVFMRNEAYDIYHSSNVSTSSATRWMFFDLEPYLRGEGGVQVPASASARLFSLLNGRGDAWLEYSYYGCEAQSVTAVSSRGPGFPLTSVISIYYL